MDYFSAKALGQTDSMIITDTAAYTGTWSYIEALADTVFNTLTSSTTKNGVADLAAAADWGTVTAGRRLYGKFTAIKLTSGSVIAYK